jgi:hypothetical protein
LADTVQGWIIGSFALDAEPDGKWLSLRGVKLARSAKVAGKDEQVLSTQKWANVFLGMATLTAIGSLLWTKRDGSIFQGSDFVDTAIA